MPEGTKTYDGMAVPLYGESEIQQQALAADILTLTGVASQTGDFLVCQLAAGTEMFVVDVNGAITITGDVTVATDKDVILQKTGQSAFGRLRLPILNTAAASAGLAKGDIWLAKATTDVYRFAICISTATGAERFGHRFTRTTIGSASH